METTISKKYELRFAFIILAFIFGVIRNSFAHYLWIEPSGGSDAKVYYGEIQEGVREKSGDRLDTILGFKVFYQKPGGAKLIPISSEKMQDHFLAKGIDGAGDVLAISKDGEVKDYTKSGIGIVKPMFYARFGPMNAENPAKPSHDLDIVPVAGSQGSFQVYFKNKPLAEAKIKIYAPNTWMQEFKTDADGKIKIEAPWSGLYVLDVVYKEETKGTFNQKPYDALRHRATYAFIR